MGFFKFGDYLFIGDKPKVRLEIARKYMFPVLEKYGFKHIKRKGQSDYRQDGYYIEFARLNEHFYEYVTIDITGRRYTIEPFINVLKIPDDIHSVDEFIHTGYGPHSTNISVVYLLSLSRNRGQLPYWREADLSIRRYFTSIGKSIREKQLIRNSKDFFLHINEYFKLWYEHFTPYQVNKYALSTLDYHSLSNGDIKTILRQRVQRNSLFKNSINMGDALYDLILYMRTEWIPKLRERGYSLTPDFGDPQSLPTYCSFCFVRNSKTRLDVLNISFIIKNIINPYISVRSYSPQPEMTSEDVENLGKCYLKDRIFVFGERSYEKYLDLKDWRPRVGLIEYYHDIYFNKGAKYIERCKAFLDDYLSDPDELFIEDKDYRKKNRDKKRWDWQRSIKYYEEEIPQEYLFE